jgi:hypothetical protein
MTAEIMNAKMVKSVQTADEILVMVREVEMVFM